MPICIICGSPNPEEKEPRYFDLPSRTRNPEWHARFMNELGIVGESDQQLRNMKICLKHFKSEDIILKKGNPRLKENALPNNFIDGFDQYYIKPELVDINKDENLEESHNEVKNFTNLDPLVVYTNDSGGSDEEEDGDCSNYVTENVETEIIEEEEEIESKKENNQNAIGTLNSVTGQDYGQIVEPMMPFYLTDPAIFTILNENNEVGETIIVQIENDCQDEAVTDDDQNEEYVKKELDVKRLKKSRNDQNVPSLEMALCSSKDRDFSSTYICEICGNSYGCVNCLRSHYDSVHICRLQIVQYKCQNSPNCPKGLYCPVCNMVFGSRTDSLDHYVTHYVACDICCATFDRPSYLAEHMKNQHNKIDQNIEYECELCRAIFHYSSYLSKHYQICHRMNLCMTCMMRFKTVQELYNHEQSHAPKLDVLPYACSLCDMAFPKVSDISVHIRAKHKNTPAASLVQSLETTPIVQNTEEKEKLENGRQKTKQNQTKKVKLRK